MNDRETLSALFDGELSDEARLFAMRRLSHDREWQQACGRWQLMGDAMRRQQTGLAPAGFAARVQQAVALECAPAASPVARAEPRAMRRSRAWPVRWAGGALAASVALVAVFVAQPFRSERPVPSAPLAGRAPVAAGAPAGEPVVASRAAVDSGARSAASTAPAVADVRPAGAPVAPATRPARASPRVRVAAVRRAPSRATAGEAAAATVVADAGNPFSLGSAQSMESRPWPRAALDSGGGAAFTARYGGSGDSPAGAPSFYPFEPRPEGEANGPPAP